MAGNRPLRRFAQIFGLIVLLTHGYLSAHAQGFELNDGASIRLLSESRSLYLGDVLVIEVESIGLLDPLDASSLFTHTDFMRETTGTRIAVVDGKVVEIALRRIELMPKQQGLLVLGPLRGEASAGNIKSNSLAINVVAAPEEDWQPEPTDIQLSMTVNKTNPLVGEQFELTVQLLHRYALAAEKIVLPELTGFDITPLMEERRLIDNSNGMRSTTWRYLLHAQRSGLHNLSGVSWSATLIKSRQQRFDFSYQHEPIQLNVDPVPNAFPENTWWIAASEISLSDRWSSNVIELSAGNEIIRTIELQAAGVLSHHLPIVEPLATRSFHSTPLPIQRSDNLIADNTVAVGLYEFRMIAESPVSVFLDTVRVPWFNTTTRQVEEAIIPARRINVAMPENPAQLAELAIRRHRLNRFTLWLRSLTIQHWLIFTAAISALLLALSVIQRHRLITLRCYLAITVERLKWHWWRYNKNWPFLYDALLRKACPFDDPVAQREFMDVLGRRMFSENEKDQNDPILARNTELAWLKLSKAAAPPSSSPANALNRTANNTSLPLL